MLKEKPGQRGKYDQVYGNKKKMKNHSVMTGSVSDPVSGALLHTQRAGWLNVNGREHEPPSVQFTSINIITQHSQGSACPKQAITELAS
jgi:hypothetical protein